MQMSALYSFFEPPYILNGLSNHGDTYIIFARFLEIFLMVVLVFKGAVINYDREGVEA